MSFNTFGKIFRFTTWGESHGPAIGCIVDGCPPNIPISEKEIQNDMDKRIKKAKPVDKTPMNLNENIYKKLKINKRGYLRKISKKIVNEFTLPKSK